MNTQSFAEKLLILRRLSALSIFSIATVVLGNVILLGLPQARETLSALDDGPHLQWGRFAWLTAAYLYWAFTAWFVTRLAFGRIFPVDTVQAGASKGPFVEQCARWIPRLLGVAATLPLAIAMIPVRHIFGSILTVVAVLFLAFVWQRRSLFQFLVDRHNGALR